MGGGEHHLRSRKGSVMGRSGGVAAAARMFGGGSANIDRAAEAEAGRLRVAALEAERSAKEEADRPAAAAEAEAAAAEDDVEEGETAGPR